MTIRQNKPLKSIRTLASESRARRKPKLTDDQIEKANKIFKEIEKEQEQIKEGLKRKIARQPEV